MKTFLASILALTFMTPAVVAQSLPLDLLGLSPKRLQQSIVSQSMTFVTSSYTRTNAAANTDIAVVTGAAGETLYLIAARAGGDTAGIIDVYTNNTRKYNSIVFAANTESGWLYMPNWESLTASGATSIALRNPAQVTGTYSATIVVGKVK